MVMNTAFFPRIEAIIMNQESIPQRQEKGLKESTSVVIIFSTWFFLFQFFCNLILELTE